MFEIIPGKKEIGAKIICDLKKIKKNHIKKIKYALQKYGMVYFKNQNLTIPHPRAWERDFVLLPLQDIAPFFRDPLTKLTIRELIKKLKDHYVIEKLSYRNLS